MNGFDMRSIVPLFGFAFAASAPVVAAEHLRVSGFRSVELRGGGDVTLRAGPVQRATIVEASSPVTRMNVERDGELRIDVRGTRCPRKSRLRVEIHSPPAPDVAIAGGGTVQAWGGFAAIRQIAA